MSIDMTRIAAVQQRAGWSSLEGVIDLLEENGTISAGQRRLTDQQIAVIDGQRRINGGLLEAITHILDSLEALGASVDPSKIVAAKKALEGLLGDVPPGCEQ